MEGQEQSTGTVYYYDVYEQGTGRFIERIKLDKPQHKGYDIPICDGGKVTDREVTHISVTTEPIVTKDGKTAHAYKLWVNTLEH